MNHSLKRGLLTTLLLLTACAPSSYYVETDGPQDTIFASGQTWMVDWGNGRKDTFTVPGVSVAKDGHFAYAGKLASGRTVRFNHALQGETEPSAYARIGIDSSLFKEDGWACLINNPDRLILGAPVSGLYIDTFDSARDELFLLSSVGSGPRCTVTRTS